MFALRYGLVYIENIHKTCPKPNRFRGQEFIFGFHKACRRSFMSKCFFNQITSLDVSVVWGMMKLHFCYCDYYAGLLEWIVFFVIKFIQCYWLGDVCVVYRFQYFDAMHFYLLTQHIFFVCLMFPSSVTIFQWIRSKTI